MSQPSRTSSPSPSFSPPPHLPAQPDHFYGNEDIQLPPSPNSDGRNWLDPADDPTAQRGIPVFKPTMEEFQDFEVYMNRVEPWGMRSGIVKIIPPVEWSECLPSVVPQLDKVRLKHPIEQHMLGQGGLFQQQNIEKRRVLSVREWYELCAKEELRAPGVDDIGLNARAKNGGAAKTRTRRTRRGGLTSASVDPDAGMPESAEPESRPVNVRDTSATVKDEQEEEHLPLQHPDPASALVSPPNSNRTLSPVEQEPGPSTRQSSTPTPSNCRHPLAEEDEDEEDVKAVVQTLLDDDSKPKRRRRPGAVQVQQVERAEKDRQWLQEFDPRTAWLPPNTDSSSYTTDFCKELERRYWRNCGFGKPPWYGADMQGSLFTDETTSWNVACLPSALTRLLPASSKGLPGVNTPYLYFGMWRATFAWHVEDMDLFSINYIHFGAPKFWYAMPQARANALEQTMRGLFPGADKNCSQFLRHKSYLASPTLLAKTSCRPNYLVQKAGEFVITFPRGYHAGFNLGFNCAESVNFALDSWIDIGRKAKACGCVNFSVRIDVDQLLYDRAVEHREVFLYPKAHRRIKTEPDYEKENDVEKAKPRRKRKSEGDAPAKSKKSKTKGALASDQEQPVASSSKLTIPSRSPIKTIKVTLKLPPPPKPKEPDTFPCCLCVSMSRDGLVRVQDPPVWWYDTSNAEAAKGPCMAHVDCANVIPETWVDEVEVGEPDADGMKRTERVVFGVDGIVKDRWNLKCTACTKTKNRTHGAPIQCTKGKCPKAFHVSCAKDGHASGIVFKILREVEKEVVLLESQPAVQAPAAQTPGSQLVQLYPTPGPSSLAEDSPSASEQPMEIDPTLVPERQPSSSPRVLKTIKKTEVEVLCHQHNPAILAAKKAQQQDRIRNALVALPPMSRIKLRVTAGVFEVTLVRIIEETCSVEVLWDRGLKREFKWRSVVFGETDGVVGHKPTEAAPEPERLPVPVRTYLPTPASVYRPSPVAGPSPAPATPATGTPTYATPPPTVTPPYTQPYGHYQQPYSYQQPGTSAYQYSSGNWTYYPQPPPPSQPTSSQPPPASHSTYNQAPPYGQPATAAGYYPFASGAAHAPYPPYPHYSGYSGYAPPQPPAAQPQMQSQAQATTVPPPLSQPHTLSQAPSQPQALSQPQVQSQPQLSYQPAPQPATTSQTSPQSAFQPVHAQAHYYWQPPYAGPSNPAARAASGHQSAARTPPVCAAQPSSAHPIAPRQGSTGESGGGICTSEAVPQGSEEVKVVSTSAEAAS